MLIAIKLQLTVHVMQNKTYNVTELVKTVVASTFNKDNIKLWIKSHLRAYFFTCGRK